MGVKEVIRKVLEELTKVRDGISPLLRARVLINAAAEGVEVNADTLGLKVLREGKDWQRKLLRELCQALGIALHPKVEAHLEGGKAWTVVSGRFEERWREAHLRLLVDGVPVFFQSFRLRQGQGLGGLRFSTWPGGAWVRTARGLYARKGHVYWRFAGLEGLGDTLEAVRSLAPLFAALDLADLEGALLALSRLEDGEARAEGRYALAREGDLRVLFRGHLFGDAALDTALLLEQEVALSGAGGVRLRLRAKVEDEGVDFRVRIAQGVLEWGGEEVHFASSTRDPRLFEEDILPVLLRDGLWFGLERGADLSRRMTVLIDELAKREDPLEALKEESFLSRVHLRLLSES
jgi:hypothetical protein